MAQKKWKAVHYVNQFYGQIGGEEAADVKFSVQEGAVGPGKQLQASLGDSVEIIATIICGDNYFSTHLDEASTELLKLVEGYAPDIFFSGPAFGAGRYGIACGHAAKVVGEKFGIPVVSGMFKENPGVDLYRSFVHIAQTHNSAAKAREDLQRMATIALHLLTNSHGDMYVLGKGIGSPEEEGYIPQYRIRNVYTKDTAAKRFVDMMLAKIKGEPFQTEMTYVEFEHIEPAKPINVKKSRIAIVSDGALVDKDNIHRLKSRGNDNWGTYQLHEFFSDDKKPDDYRVSHTGYFHMDVLEDPNRIVPYDVMSEMAAEKEIGELVDTYYVTSGNCNSDKGNVRIGAAIAQRLQDDKVDAVIITST